MRSNKNPAAYNYMNVSGVTAYIRALSGLKERLEHGEIYSSVVQDLPSLSKLIKDTCQRQHWLSNRGAGLTFPLHRRPAGSSSWALSNVDTLYAINLLRKCILTKFQVLCVANTGPSTVCSTCQEIAQSVEVFNTQVVSILAQTRHNTSIKYTQLSFADFIDVLVTHRSECIANAILSSSCKVENVLNTARNEALCIESLVATFNAHSSLLYEDESTHLVLEQLPSRSSPCRGLDTPSGKFEEGMFLKLSELVVSYELWREVALCLRYRIRFGGQQCLVKELATAAAQELIKEQDLSAAAKCMQYLVTTLTVDGAIIEWDKGFQSMLAASQKPMSCKKSCKPVELLCTSVIPPIQHAILALDTNPEQSQPATPASIAEHLDYMRTFPHLLTSLMISVQAISNTLRSSLELILANGNLAILVQYTFAEVPLLQSTVSDVELAVRKAQRATRFHPESPGEYLRVKIFLTSYNKLQNTFCHMNECLERTCVQFHDFLQDHYKHCLCTVFPTAKQWSTFGRQNNTHTSEHPSKYCDMIVEQLILPTSEAARLLQEHSQRALMTLSASILLNEYRKAIMKYKHTYRLPAGRQLLVDFHHISEWMTSEKLGLQSSTIQSLSNLPVVGEMERGLQLLSHGTIALDPALAASSQAPDTSSSRSLECVRGLSSLHVWSEIAWYSHSDWKECAV